MKHPISGGGPAQPCPPLPAALPELLLDWYDKNARPLPWRDDTLPYHVWVSEVMLQQTGAEVAAGYYRRFLQALPTMEDLAAADEQTLYKLWEGLGYYARVRNLQKTARRILEDYGGRFPEDREELLQLPGIGPYTAGAIASICFEQPVAAVDGNVVRVIGRIAGMSGLDKSYVKKYAAAALEPLYPRRRRGDFTQSLMELGALVCVPGGPPKCTVCPVFRHCASYPDGGPPPPARRPAKKRQELTVLLLTCGGDTALRRRPDTGLLAGLWELPNVPDALTASQAIDLAEKWGAAPHAVLGTTQHTHTFTHIRWDMTCHRIDCAQRAPQLIWADQNALASAYPLPTAFKKLLAQPRRPSDARAPSGQTTTDRDD